MKKEKTMKATISVFLMSMMASASVMADCSRMPQADGPVSGRWKDSGVEYSLQAQVSVRELTQQWPGQPEQVVKMHEFKKVRFMADGKRVYPTRSAAGELLRGMFGYEHLEYVTLTPARAISGPFLNDQLRIEKKGGDLLALDPKGVVIPYHSQCASWRY